MDWIHLAHGWPSDVSCEHNNAILRVVKGGQFTNCQLPTQNGLGDGNSIPVLINMGIHRMFIYHKQHHPIVQ